jgi:hypothetical protein
MFRLLLILLFLPYVKVNAQKELFIDNRVKQYTGYRQRFSPDQIAKEIYAWTKFDQQGNIIEKYEPYNIPSSGSTKYTYNTKGELIKIESYYKDGTLNEISEFSDKPDSKKRNSYLPAYPSESYFVWTTRFALLSGSSQIGESVKIDTFRFNNRNFDTQIQLIEQNKFRINTAYINLRKNKILFFHETTKIENEITVSNRYLFNRKEQLIEKFSDYSGSESFHFKFEYRKNGLLKKVIAYSKDGKVAEICWYKAEYYH